MSRVRTGITAGDWKDEGAQEHVTRTGKTTFGGALVTEQPFYPTSLRVPSPGEVQQIARREQRRLAAKQ